MVFHAIKGTEKHVALITLHTTILWYLATFDADFISTGL
jgi:hypothetical protein